MSTDVRTTRFLRAVEKLGVVESDVLVNVRKQASKRQHDVDWVAQELLKRSELSPKQVVALIKALAGTQERAPARAETLLRGNLPSHLRSLETRVLPPREPSVGETLGDRFELTEEIGRGAQGIVYRAHDSRMSRDVAVKVLRTVTPLLPTKWSAAVPTRLFATLTAPAIPVVPSPQVAAPASARMPSSQFGEATT
ncbi:hypothetical protein OAX78_02485 [Planctomycetota bacterium]|nr:hypothetical protein [Planctomycetota bacterium]